MAINLGNFFQNAPVQNNSSSDAVNQVFRDAANAVAAQDSNALRDAVQQLRNLMVGDIFSGEVTGMQDGRVSINLGGGQEIMATLQNTIAMNSGEKLMFMVQSNNANQISLKVLDSNSQEMVMMNKALSAAGMAVNDTTMNMVKSLLDNNMPIDRQTLNELSRQMLKFPDAPVDTLVRLNKLNIPVTESNINQFEAYRSYEHQITGTLNHSVESFSELMGKLADDGKAAEGLKLFSEMTEILTGDRTEESGTPENTRPENHMPEKDVLISDNTARELSMLLSGDDMPPKLQHLAQKIGQQPMTPKEFTRELETVLKDETIPKESLSKLASSHSFTKLFSEMVQKELLMTPEEAAKKEEVKDFYERLYEKTRNLTELLQKGGEPAQNLSKNFSAVRENVQFMNDLSQNMMFMQFPVRLPNGQAQGDLYVYTNKKSLREHPDNISALLHLDMEYLGPMDIYVKMSGKNVSTNFCLESEEMLDFIYEHIDELNKRIDKLGLNFQFTMNVKEETEGNSEQPVSFTEDFLDKSAPVVSVKSYLFDSKA